MCSLCGRALTAHHYAVMPSINPLNYVSMYKLKNFAVHATPVQGCMQKALVVVGGQAEVIDERCIACGNCTRGYSQGAKVFLNTTDRVIKLLENNREVVGSVRSFPAEFSECSRLQDIGWNDKSWGF